MPDPNWLWELSAALVENPACVVGGRVINQLENNPYSESSQLLIGYLYGYYNGRNGSPTFFTSNNFAVRAELFNGVGGFDPRLPRAAAEDREFCDRWINLGHRMAYAPSAIVRHAHLLTFHRFWRQHFNYGRGAYFFREVRVRRGAAKISVEPASFYSDLLRYPLSQTRGSRAVTCCALLFVSQLANTAGFFWERFRRQNIRTDDAVKRLTPSTHPPPGPMA